MPGPILVLDTCVLVPKHLRDFLIHVASAGFYRPCWNTKILGDLKGVLINKVGYYSVEDADAILDDLRGLFPKAEVPLRPDRIGTLLTAQKDQHVLDAAIEGDALAIVTKNTRDFPDESVRPYEIEIWTPDDLLLFCAEPLGNRILGVVQDHAERVGLSGEEFLRKARSLEQAAPRFVELALGAFVKFPGHRFPSRRPI